MILVILFITWLLHRDTGNIVYYPASYYNPGYIA